MHPSMESSLIPLELQNTVFPQLWKRKAKKEIAGTSSDFTTLHQIKECCLQCQLRPYCGQTGGKFGFFISLGFAGYHNNSFKAKQLLENSQPSLIFYYGKKA